MPSMTRLVEKLKTLPYYKNLFTQAFGSSDITSDRISKALSQFLRSIESFNSKYDQGLSTQFSNFTQEELNGKANIIRFFCTECHSDLKTAGNRNNPSFLIVENFGLNNKKLGDKFLGTNNGLNDTFKDNGIGEITGQPQDMGTFKTPSLRNIALTAPYMHDGRFKTLEEVLEHYRTGIKAHPNRGIQIQAGGIPLSTKEKTEIIAFLKTLTDASLATNSKYSDPFK